MGSIQAMSSAISAFASSRFREFGCFYVESDHSRASCRTRVSGLARMGIGGHRRVRVFSKSSDEDRQSNGEEPPESLFMKELKRRGISPGSLSEETSKNAPNQEIQEKAGDATFATRGAVSTDSDNSLTNQREQSMALNSEGLEGLIPRAKLLLTLGGTFFIGFGPLILGTVVFFSALYLYFGPSFVHDGSQTSHAPQYIDPYVLLQEEVFPQ